MLPVRVLLLARLSVATPAARRFACGCIALILASILTCGAGLWATQPTIPPLTTVRQTVADMGRTAAQALLLLLAGQPIALPTFEAKLVIRESAAMLRI
jgi:hypothetical protein